MKYVKASILIVEDEESVRTSPRGGFHPSRIPHTVRDGRPLCTDPDSPGSSGHPSFRPQYAGNVWALNCSPLFTAGSLPST